MQLRDVRGRELTGSSADLAGQTKTLREEVQHLFGLRWDSFVEWTIITWLSLWLYTSWAVTNAIVFPVSGPIEWIAELLRALEVPPPDWLTGIPDWLSVPDRAWLLQVFVIAAATFATLSLRGFLPDRRDRDERRSSFYYPAGVFERYLTRVAGLFAAPIYAPALLALALVASYETVVPYRPSVALADDAARALDSEDGGASLAEADALAVVSALVAAMTAHSENPANARVSAAFHHRWKQREARRVAQARAERTRESWLLRSSTPWQTPTDV